MRRTRTQSEVMLISGCHLRRRLKISASLASSHWSWLGSTCVDVMPSMRRTARS